MDLKDKNQNGNVQNRNVASNVTASKSAAKAWIKNILTASSLAAITLGSTSTAFAITTYDIQGGGTTFQAADGKMSANCSNANTAFVNNDGQFVFSAVATMTNEYEGAAGGKSNYTIPKIDFGGQAATWNQNKGYGTITLLTGAGGGTFDAAKDVTITEVNEAAIVIQASAADSNITFGDEDQTFATLTLAANAKATFEVSSTKSVTGTIDGGADDRGILTYKSTAPGTILTQVSKIGDTHKVAKLVVQGDGNFVAKAAVKATNIKLTGAGERAFDAAVTGDVNIEGTGKNTFTGLVTGNVNIQAGDNHFNAAAGNSIVGKLVMTGGKATTKEHITAGLDMSKTAIADVTGNITLGGLTMSDDANAKITGDITAGGLTMSKNAIANITGDIAAGDVSINDDAKADVTGDVTGAVTIDSSAKSTFGGATGAFTIKKGEADVTGAVDAVTMTGGKGVFKGGAASADISGAAQVTFSGRGLGANLTIKDTAIANLDVDIGRAVTTTAAGEGNIVVGVSQTGNIGAANLWLDTVKTKAGAGAITFANVYAKSIEINDGGAVFGNANVGTDKIILKKDTTIQSLAPVTVANTLVDMEFDGALAKLITGANGAVKAKATTKADEQGVIEVANGHVLTWTGDIGTAKDKLEKLELAGNSGGFIYKSGDAYFKDLTFANAAHELKFSSEDGGIFAVTNKVGAAGLGAIITEADAGKKKPLTISIDTTHANGIALIQLGHDRDQTDTRGIPNVIFDKAQKAVKITQSGTGWTRFAEDVEVTGGGGDAVDMTGAGRLIFAKNFQTAGGAKISAAAGNIFFLGDVEAGAHDLFIDGFAGSMAFGGNVKLNTGTKYLKANVADQEFSFNLGGKDNKTSNNRTVTLEATTTHVIDQHADNDATLNVSNFTSEYFKQLSTAKEGVQPKFNSESDYGKDGLKLTFVGAGLTKLSNHKLKAIDIGDKAHLDVGKLNVKAGEINLHGKDAKFTATFAASVPLAVADQEIEAAITAHEEGYGQVFYTNSNNAKALSHKGAIGTADKAIYLLETKGAGEVKFDTAIYANKIVFGAEKNTAAAGAVLLEDAKIEMGSTANEVSVEGDVSAKENGFGKIVYNAAEKDVTHKGKIGEQAKKLGSIETNGDKTVTLGDAGAGVAAGTHAIFAEEMNLTAQETRLLDNVTVKKLTLDGKLTTGEKGTYEVTTMTMGAEGSSGSSGSSIENAGKINFGKGSQDIGNVKNTTSAATLTFKGGNVKGNVEGGTVNAAGTFEGAMGRGAARSVEQLNIKDQQTVFKGVVFSKKTDVNKEVTFAQDASLGEVSLTDATLNVGSAKIIMEKVTILGVNTFKIDVNRKSSGQVSCASTNLDKDKVKDFVKLELNMNDAITLETLNTEIGTIFDDVDVSKIPYNHGSIKIAAGKLVVTPDAGKIANQTLTLNDLSIKSGGESVTEIFKATEAKVLKIDMSEDEKKAINEYNELLSKSSTAQFINVERQQGSEKDTAEFVRALNIESSSNQKSLEVSTMVVNDVTSHLSSFAVPSAPAADFAAPAAGENEVYEGKMATWISGHTAQGDQKLDAAKPAYKAQNSGATFGADYLGNIAGHGIIFGGAFTFDNSDIKYKKGIKEGDKTKVSSNIFSLYTNVDLYKGLFARGLVSYGTSSIKSDTMRNKMISKGEYTTTFVVTQMEAGYNHTVDNITAFATLGGRYSNSTTPEYTEKGNSVLDQKVKKSSLSQFDVVGSVGINAIIVSDDVSFIPNTKFSVAKKVAGKTPETKYTIGDLPSEFKASAGKQDATVAELSAGFNVKYQNFDFGVKTSYGFANKYSNVGGSLVIRAEF